jgi:serine/threonine-protein kinase RsbW
MLRSETDDPVIEIMFAAPVEPASLQGIHRSLARLWAQEEGVASKDKMLFATAVAEVATNIIKHRADGSRSDMALTLRIDADQIEAVFSDDGIAVDMSVVPESSQDELSESGRGLVIASAALDELTYERAGAVNRWHLVRRRFERLADPAAHHVARVSTSAPGDSD